MWLPSKDVWISIKVLTCSTLLGPFELWGFEAEAVTNWCIISCCPMPGKAEVSGTGGSFWRHRMLLKTARDWRKRASEKQISFPSSDESNSGKLKLGSLNQIWLLQNLGVSGLWFWAEMHFCRNWGYTRRDAWFSWGLSLPFCISKLLGRGEPVCIAIIIINCIVLFIFKVLYRDKLIISLQHPCEEDGKYYYLCFTNGETEPEHLSD